MKNGERGEKGELNKNWDTEKRCVTCKVLEKRKKRTRKKKRKRVRISTFQKGTVGVFIRRTSLNGCSLSCTSSNEFAGVDFLLVERGCAGRIFH